MNNFTNSVFVTNGSVQTAEPLGNVFVLPKREALTGVICKSILGFRSLIPTSVISGANEDPKYPFANCLDYRDNTQYSPSASSGSVVIEFSQQAESMTDYIGIAISNASTAQLTGKVELQVNGVWTEVANIVPRGDNKTICEYFEPQLSSRQRITLEFTSKLFIGTIYLGKSWTFERLPNLGFTPADSNNIDEVIGFKNNRGQFTMGRRKEVGYAQSGAFDFIDFEKINTDYIAFMHHVKDSKAFFMKWDVEMDSSIFGQHASPNSLQAPTYSNANSSTFNFSMVGYN